MILPRLNQVSRLVQQTETFMGYNHNLKIGAGEWYEEENLSAREFPLFAPRAPRGLVMELEEPGGIFAKQLAAWIDDNVLYYGGTAVGVTLTAEPGCIRQFVSMGAYLLVFPDGVYVNTADLTDCGSLGANWTAGESAEVSYTLCRQSGEPYDMSRVTVADEAPASPVNGDYWIDTSETLHVLNQWSEQSAMWVQIPTVYVKISSAGIGAGFSAADGVTLSGCELADGSDILKEQVAALNGGQVIQAADDDSIVVVGLLDAVCSQAGGVTVARSVPQLDYVCECGNRLWGCHYGVESGTTLNEVYACALGDFRNWSRYEGISTDSYTASIGTDGPFTGAVNYNGRVIFFKEDCMHIVSGTQPSTFQITSTPCRGVQKGCGASLAIVNEALLYKSREGICLYDGSLPVNVSDALGQRRYGSAVAGSHEGRYYVSMTDEETGERSLFVYDVKRGTWHREDGFDAAAFASLDGELYGLELTEKKVFAMTGRTGTAEGDVEWSATSGVIGYETPMQKYLSRFVLRIAMPKGSWLRLALRYDSKGDWEDQGAINASEHALNSFVFPVIPRRCDHLQLRLTGKGEVRVFSIARTYEAGGDQT